MSMSDQDKKITVVIVDDHPIVREGLSQVVNGEEDMTVIGMAETCCDALELIAGKHPTIALVDLSLRDSNGLELIKDLRLRHPDVVILVLSMHDETFYAERVLRAGARGYITKEEAVDKVITGIRRVLAGEIFLSQNMAGKMLSKMVEGRNPNGLSVERLSDRELEVFDLIGQGMGTRQIARQLHLSIKTVGSHRAHVKQKLKLKTGTELLRHAIQWVQSSKGSQAKA